MSEDTKLPPQGSDWTRLLTDPDLVSHLGKLLQTYRDVPPEQREAALLLAMRDIKDAAVKGRENERDLQKDAQKTVQASPAPPAELNHPEPVNDTPPFDPNLLRSQSESGRRRFQRQLLCRSRD